jgi:hypothetical protein
MCGSTRSLAVLVCSFMMVGFSLAQKSTSSKQAAGKNGLSDASYIAKALTAAPPGVAKAAGVARIDGSGNVQTLRESKNGFTCLIMLNDVMCADANSMAFFDATMKNQTPPDKLGLTYMLRGDQGASNTDPSATGKTADNHWVVTGPHIMIVGAAVKDLRLADSADADPTKPYLMWPNTPYAHAMIPVSGSAAHATSAKTPSDMKGKEEMK